METQNQPEDFEYYSRRLQEEFERLETDVGNIKRLARESLFAFLREVAEQIGLTLEKFLDWFGPLFHDSDGENIDENE